MTYSIQGARLLDRELSVMDRTGLVGWLKTGFEHLDSGEIDDVSTAFPPLWLRPDSEPMSQFAVALREAEAAGQFAPDRIRSAVRAHLTHPSHVQRDSLSDMRRFWELLGSAGCDPSILKDARIFIEHLRDFHVATDGARDELGEVVGAVVTAVASSRPLTPSHGQFFRFLRKQDKLWRTSFIPLLIDVEFELNAGRRGHDTATARLGKLWDGLRYELGEDLRDQVTASSAPGRALIRSVFRRLYPEQHVPMERDAATELEARLFENAARPAERLVTTIPEFRVLPGSILEILGGDSYVG